MCHFYGQKQKTEHINGVEIELETGTLKHHSDLFTILQIKLEINKTTPKEASIS